MTTFFRYVWPLFLLYIDAALCSFTSRLDDYYTEIQEVNSSVCLDKVLALNVRYYQFKYDTIIGRQRLGVIPSEIVAMPECLQTVKRYVAIEPTTKETIYLENFLDVDKNSIFMYSVGAMKELVRTFGKIENKLSHVEFENNQLFSAIDELQRRFNREINDSIVQQQRLATEELLGVELTRTFEKTVSDEALQTQLLRQNKDLDAQRIQQLLLEEQSRFHDEAERNRTMEVLRITSLLESERDALRKQADNEAQQKRFEMETQLEDIRRRGDIERIQAEAQARAKYERENQDITIRKLQVKADEDRKRILQTIDALFSQSRSIVAGAVSDKKRLGYVVSSIILILVCYFSFRELFSFLRNMAMSLIGRPSLIRETSRRSLLIEILVQSCHLVITCGGLIKTSKLSSVDHFESEFNDVILPSSTKARVIELAKSTYFTRRNGANFRHVLLYGPPGTGKTMVARKLSTCSGMDYVILSGADVVPLGQEAVTEVHKLFDWAKKSRKGVVIFIDEAEAFLASRSDSKITQQSEHVRNTLNALLYHTGTHSSNFMLILATNRPEDLDDAILDRMDETIHFSLPEEEERLLLIKLYFGSYILNFMKRTGIDEKNAVDGEILTSYNSKDSGGVMSTTARDSTGMSGREIAKLMISIQSIVIVKKKVTMSDFVSCVEIKRSDKVLKMLAIDEKRLSTY